jgi:hypothetical protein
VLLSNLWSLRRNLFLSIKLQTFSQHPYHTHKHTHTPQVGEGDQLAWGGLSATYCWSGSRLLIIWYASFDYRIALPSTQQRHCECLQRFTCVPGTTARASPRPKHGGTLVVISQITMCRLPQTHCAPPGGNLRNSFLRVLYTPVRDGLHQMCGGDLTTSTHLTPHTKSHPSRWVGARELWRSLPTGRGGSKSHLVG